MIDPTQLRTGELLEGQVVVEGVRIEFLAIVQVSGATLHLQHLAIYPAGVDRAAVAVAALLRVVRQELYP